MTETLEKQLARAKAKVLEYEETYGPDDLDSAIYGWNQALVEVERIEALIEEQNK
jgi:hypothetical protein